MTAHPILGPIAPVESLGRATLEAINASGGCSISAELAGINARAREIDAERPATPLALDAPWPNGEIRLWDTQWVNIVNGDCANPSLDRGDAVSLAIKLTEQAMRKNYEAELTTRRARDAEVAELVEAASDFSATMTHSISMTNLGAEWEGKPHPVPARHPVRVAIATLDAALLPFQRSDDKGDAT